MAEGAKLYYCLAQYLTETKCVILLISFICFNTLQSKNIVLEKTVEYISQVNDQLEKFNDLQQREQKQGKKYFV